MPLNCSTAFRSRILGRESFDDIMGGGCIRIFTGAQPANADAPEQGDLLGVATAGGLPWAAGNAANGIIWDQVGAWVQPRVAVSLTASGSGVAGWFRAVALLPDAGGVSYSFARFDGAIGTASDPHEMTWPSTTLAQGSVYPFGSLFFGLPPLS